MFRDYELLARSGLFDSNYYLKSNPDIRNIDPLLHYVEIGAKEGRRPSPNFDVPFYLEQCLKLGQEPYNPLVHFLTFGETNGLKATRENLEIIPSVKQSSSNLAAVKDLLLGIDAMAIETMSDGSYQLTARGWAVADADIGRIWLEVDDESWGYAAYGLFTPQIAAGLPNNPKADHCGFSFQIESLPNALPAKLDFFLSLIDSDGSKYRRAFSYDTLSAKILYLPSSKELAATSVRARPNALPPIRLEIDEIEVTSRGLLLISGWAASFVDVVSVRISLNSVGIGTADFGLGRDDVAIACPEYPKARNAGFRFRGFVGHFGKSTSFVTVQVFTASGATREAVFPVDVPHVSENIPEAEVFNFHCDEISLTTGGTILISGWVVCGAPTETIGISVDGKNLGLAELQGDRPDVGNVFSHIAHARFAGFMFAQALAIEFAQGEHIVLLHIVDCAGLEREVPLPVLALESTNKSFDSNPESVVDTSSVAAYLDLPKIVDGVADTPVSGSLTIAGWALAYPGVNGISVTVGGKTISKAHYGVRREDVALAYPGRIDALMSGFAALIPNWLLPKGRQTMSICVKANDGQVGTIDFEIDVEEMPEGDGPWALRKNLPYSEVELSQRVLVGLEWMPSFRICVLMTGVEELLKVRETISSLRNQAYADWQAAIIYTGSRATFKKMTDSVMKGLEDVRPKVRVLLSGPTNYLCDLCLGEMKDEPNTFIAVCRAGDTFACDALLEFAVTSGMNQQGDFFYSDDRRYSSVTKSMQAYFKPAWSPDLLTSSNYIGRSWISKASLLKPMKHSVSDWLTLGDYDLVLRVTEIAKMIRHIPKVLLEMNAIADDQTRVEKVALKLAMSRRKEEAIIKPGCMPGIYRTDRRLRSNGLVSIIIPTCAARGLIRACLHSLKEKTKYTNYEIICIENIPAEKHEWKEWLRQNADIVIETFEPFNWSRYNNLCAERAAGKFLLFLNDDIEIIDPDWLDTLLKQAERQGVGVVGPQLLHEDRSVQHAGLALTSLGKARHIFRHAQPDDPGYFGLALTERNVIGVTGACLLTRREVYEAVGRFDEAHTVVNNDLDFCLKTWRHGYLNIYTPYAQLIHHELASRGELGDDYDDAAFVSEWRDVFSDGDPYLNPNLSREFDDMSPEREPIKVVSTGHPLIAKELIRKVLVVKLDHIGDCITALPALRRLKEIFPNARFFVLSNKATRSIWTTEPSVDDVLHFDFFHARSGLGKKELASNELLLLQDNLKGYYFDLAIDLRKSPDTRRILQYTGARYLAGFDHRGEYPWLDVALEWEGDVRYAPKRQHVADDLLNLVEAVGTSCRKERSIFRADAGVELTLPANDCEMIFSKPVVCIHPASGTEMRQWSPTYFAEVIDLLLTRHSIHAVIIGGPDENEIAKKVLEAVRTSVGVYSLVGKLKLSELPTLIAKCILFIGNNSGPKHISAALGVPTIGVHSGVIDSNEWGPLGESAIAIRRNMSCSPCYIEKRGDCPKDLACIRRLSPGAVYDVAARMLAMKIGIRFSNNINKKIGMGIADPLM